MMTCRSTKKSSGMSWRWNEDEDPPDRVEAAAVNQWLFNTDTVDKLRTPDDAGAESRRGRSLGQNDYLCQK